MDRELRFQHICHGTPHHIRIVASDRTQMQVVNPVQAGNLCHRSTDDLEVEPTRHALQRDRLPIAGTH